MSDSTKTKSAVTVCLFKRCRDSEDAYTFQEYFTSRKVEDHILIWKKGELRKDIYFRKYQTKIPEEREAFFQLCQNEAMKEAAPFNVLTSSSMWIKHNYPVISPCRDYGTAINSALWKILTEEERYYLVTQRLGI